MKTALLGLWLIATVGWLALVWTWGAAHWPGLSLDLPANDPAVKAALQQAEMQHMVLLAGVGILPPLIVLWLGRMMAGRS